MEELNKIIEKIKSHYSPEYILNLLDEEIYNWDYGYDDETINEYESRWDFYQDYNNKEAEDVVVNEILLVANSSSNDLFELGESIYLEFMEWLEDYTRHQFN